MKYIPIWKKYLPAILQFMNNASKEKQEYQFLRHEFGDLNPKQQGSYSFEMKVYKGRMITKKGDSPVADDLLTMLRQSDKAQNLMDESTFEFSLDKDFLLKIKQIEPDEQ